MEDASEALQGAARRVSRCRAPSLILVLTPVLAALVVGCNGRSGITPVPPRNAREALQRINGNLSKIERGLYCPATTSFRFRDANGVDRRFLFHPATVIFESPRCLYFNIKHSLGGSVAHIGSNDEYYWLWVDIPDTRKLWYGSWEALEKGRARGLAVPPSQLLDALMLRPLPEHLPAGLPPLLLVGGDDHRLLFLELGEDGWPQTRRELVLDPRPPYMPIEIIDRLADGRVVMHAHLSGYKPVKGTGPDGPYTARRYVVYWELDEAEMRLDLADVRYRVKDIPPCDFPGAWEGEVEPLDERPATELGDAAQEGAFER